MSEPAITIALRIEESLLGHVLACDAETLRGISPKPFPPGRPLSLTMLLPDGELALSGRCIGSKRGDDGRFELRVRLTNLRREARERIEHAFPPHP